MHSKREKVSHDWRLYVAVNDLDRGVFKVGATNDVEGRDGRLNTDRPYARHRVIQGRHLAVDHHRNPRAVAAPLARADIVRNASPVAWRIVRSFSSPRAPQGLWNQARCTRVERAFHVALEEQGLLVRDAASNQQNPRRCVELFRVEPDRIVAALVWLENLAGSLRGRSLTTAIIGRYPGYTPDELAFIERLARRLAAVCAAASATRDAV